MAWHGRNVIKLKVLGCYGGSVKGRYLSCYLLNDTIVLDAGSLTHTLTLEEQLRVKHIILTHSHLDHNSGLPFFADNVFGRIDEAVVVYGTPPVVASLRKHMFNDVLWPDFSRLPSHRNPTLRFIEIHDGQPFRIDRVTLTPIPVNHITPTVGFVIRDAQNSILFTSDTGPTELVWEVANRTKNLKAIITEASFPNEEEGLARASGHMTPELLERELQKLGRRVRVLITHLKPGHRGRIARQLRSLGIRRMELLQQGKTYRF
jgi:ribonuclease BN (tRNA processing enzyme)